MSLFVGNISRNISLKDLEEEFNKFGMCKINHRGGYAFIEYSDERDGEEAMLELHGKNMGGLALNIEWSKRSSRFNIKESRVALKNNKDKCYNCGKPGHISRECKEGPECYECGGFGHIARDCSKNKESNNRKRSPRKSPKRTSSERSYSIEKNCLPAQFYALELQAKGEENFAADIELDDGSLFVPVSGSANEETSIVKCLVCEKTIQKNSTKRHIQTKGHKDKLVKN